MIIRINISALLLSLGELQLSEPFSVFVFIVIKLFWEKRNYIIIKYSASLNDFNLVS